MILRKRPVRDSTMRIIKNTFLGILLSCCLYPHPPAVNIKRAENPPEIDGVLFDQCWKSAVYALVIVVLIAQPVKSENAILPTGS